MSRPDKKRKRDDDDQSEPIAEQSSKVPKVQSANHEDSGANLGEVKKKTGTARQKKSERKTKKQIKREEQKAQKALRVASKKRAANVDGLATGQDFVSLGGDENEIKQVSRVKFLKREGRSSKGSSPRSIRKQKQAEKKASEAAEAAATTTTTTTSATTSTPKPAAKEHDPVANTVTKDEGSSNSQHKSRFIVFVGNLPYDATTEQIQAHFAKLEPASIRHQTDKKTGQSKGFAFLEFINYDRMKTCLQLYHHSIFDPHATTTTASESDNNNNNNNKKPRGRKLNVELTAGGGGKSNDRKNKILEKNKKLSEERERVKLKQLKKKADGERKRILKAEKEAKTGKKRTGANAEAVVAAAGDPAIGDIHPSRLARVQG